MSQSNLKLLKVDQCGDPDYVKQYNLQTIISQLQPPLRKGGISVMDNGYAISLTTDIVYSNCVPIVRICLPFLSHSWNSYHTLALYKHPFTNCNVPHS